MFVNIGINDDSDTVLAILLQYHCQYRQSYCLDTQADMHTVDPFLSLDHKVMAIKSLEMTQQKDYACELINCEVIAVINKDKADQAPGPSGLPGH